MTEFLELLDKFGISFVITGLVIFLLYRIGNILIRKIEIEIDRLNRKEIELEGHQFFIDIDKAEKVDLQQINFQDDFRQLLVKDVLKIYISTVKEKFTELIGVDIGHKSNVEFKSWIMNEMFEMYEEIESGLQQMQIPHQFLEKYALFTMPLKNVFLAAIEGVCESNIHPNNKAKLYEILSLKKAILFAKIRITEKAIALLNGDLNNLEYKGVKAKHVDPVEKQEQPHKSNANVREILNNLKKTSDDNMNK